MVCSLGWGTFLRSSQDFWAALVVLSTSLIVVSASVTSSGKLFPAFFRLSRTVSAFFIIPGRPLVASCKLPAVLLALDTVLADDKLLALEVTSPNNKAELTASSVAVTGIISLPKGKTARQVLEESLADKYGLDR